MWQQQSVSFISLCTRAHAALLEALAGFTPRKLLLTRCWSSQGSLQ